uniref:F-box domain-containing protein n=1 Tax=Mycena chlorophos TaxID=658473 RepID=A0ABQ0KU67_MYCCL|nr:predicted protein [Mycena chlorophos]
MQIQDLPPELLSLIFEHSAADLDLKASSYVIPLTSSHVSMHWRAVALSTLDLWSFIFISPSSNGLQLRPSIQLVKRWLVRSGQRPLVFRITLQTDDNPGHGPVPGLNPNAVLRLLATHSYRWQKIAICVAEESHLEGLPACRAPNLVSMRVDYHIQSGLVIPIVPGVQLRTLEWKIP